MENFNDRGLFTVTRKVKALQSALLDWYGSHKRVMPWRAVRGRPNPYHVWLSEIMLQQTTVATVGPYFQKFIQRWPTVSDLAGASQDEVLTAWAGLGYYARARNLHKCANVIDKEFKGKFPNAEAALLTLPGVGPYTAAAIASIAFGRQAVAVDGNVERVVSRYFAVKEPLPASKPLLKEKAVWLAQNNPNPADFTQAFMELGATVCTPRSPKCGLCPWQKTCKAKKDGITSALPTKLKKKSQPVRYGDVFWIVRSDGAFLAQKRGSEGLYAGMYQLPPTDWVKNAKVMRATALEGFEHVKFLPVDVKIKHSFTHFDLVLSLHVVKTQRKSLDKKLKDSLWVLPKDIDNYAFPTLMKKVMRVARQSGY